MMARLATDPESRSSLERVWPVASVADNCRHCALNPIKATVADDSAHSNREQTNLHPHMHERTVQMSHSGTFVVPIQRDLIVFVLLVLKQIQVCCAKSR